MKNDLEDFIKESVLQENNQNSDVVKVSFKPMSLNEMSKALSENNISLDTPVKFESEGRHISAKTLMLVSAPGKQPYLLLDV